MSQQVNTTNILPECSPVQSVIAIDETIDLPTDDFEKGLGAFVGRVLQFISGGTGKVPGFWVSFKGRKFFVKKDTLFPIDFDEGSSIPVSGELFKLTDAKFFNRPRSVEQATRNLMDRMFKIKRGDDLANFSFKRVDEPTLRPAGALTDMIDGWSNTSSDTAELALLAQRAAMKEFKLPFKKGKWLNNVFKSETTRKQAALKEVMASDHPFFSKMDRQTQQAFLFPKSEYVPKLKEIRELEKAGFGSLYGSGLRGMYDLTQEALKKANVKELTVFRGMHWPKEVVPNWVVTLPKAGKIDNVDVNPISSWTLSRETAEQFAKKARGDTGVVITARIPADQVLSGPSTGFGVPTEKEITILGRPVVGLLERFK